MTRAASLFRAAMRERRACPRGSLDWQYLTRAARAYARLMRSVPVNQWQENSE